MVIILIFLISLLIIYLVEFRIKKNIYRMLIVIGVIIFAINFSIHFGSNANQAMALNVYSRGLERLMGKLSILSQNKKYKELDIYLKKLHEDLPLAIHDRTEFLDLVEYVKDK